MKFPVRLCIIVGAFLINGIVSKADTILCNTNLLPWRDAMTSCYDAGGVPLSSKETFQNAQQPRHTILNLWTAEYQSKDLIYDADSSLTLCESVYVREGADVTYGDRTLKPCTDTNKYVCCSDGNCEVRTGSWHKAITECSVLDHGHLQAANVTNGYYWTHTAVKRHILRKGCEWVLEPDSNKRFYSCGYTGDSIHPYDDTSCETRRQSLCAFHGFVDWNHSPPGFHSQCNVSSVFPISLVTQPSAHASRTSTSGKTERHTFRPLPTFSPPRTNQHIYTPRPFINTIPSSANHAWTGFRPTSMTLKTTNFPNTPPKRIQITTKRKSQTYDQTTDATNYVTSESPDIVTWYHLLLPIATHGEAPVQHVPTTSSGYPENPTTTSENSFVINCNSAFEWTHSSDGNNGIGVKVGVPIATIIIVAAVATVAVILLRRRQASNAKNNREVQSAVFNNATQSCKVNAQGHDPGKGHSNDTYMSSSQHSAAGSGYIKNINTNRDSLGQGVDNAMYMTGDELKSAHQGYSHSTQCRSNWSQKNTEINKRTSTDYHGGYAVDLEKEYYYASNLFSGVPADKGGVTSVKERDCEYGQGTSSDHEKGLYDNTLLRSNDGRTKINDDYDNGRFGNNC